MIVSVAGTGAAWSTTPTGDTGPAFGATLSDEVSVGATAAGALIVGDRDRVRTVGAPPRGQDATGFSVPSKDGGFLYQFDLSGRHLSTMDALTGIELVRFSYDGAGRVTAITDRDGNTATVERGPSGTPLAIVSADGQRTSFTLDSNGYLASVENPAGEVVSMQYDGNGLAASPVTRVRTAPGGISRDRNRGSVQQLP
jgi:YD repeat-containing protein